MTTTSPSELPPADHELMLKVAQLCHDLGYSLCDLADRLTPEQELKISKLLPHYTTLLITLGKILDLQSATGVINAFIDDVVPNPGGAN